MVLVRIVSPDRLQNRPPAVTVRPVARGYKTLALSATLTRTYKLKKGDSVLLVLDEKKGVLYLRFVGKHTRQTHRIAIEGANRSLIVRIKARSATFLPVGTYEPKMRKRSVGLSLGEGRRKLILKNGESKDESCSRKT